MDEVELGLLDKLALALLDEVESNQRLCTKDLCDWHRRWLGNVFSWAGQYRSVNMAKDGFQFAAAHLIPQLMQKFETDFLDKFTPCEGMSDEELEQAYQD